LIYGISKQRVIVCTGALKATNNAGLQPAMDHILENDGKPVPELGSVAAAQPAVASGDGEDDEDMELLQAKFGGAATAGSSSGDAPSDGSAKVCGPFRLLLVVLKGVPSF
jgi:hypothetical protein